MANAHIEERDSSTNSDVPTLQTVTQNGIPSFPRSHSSPFFDFRNAPPNTQSQTKHATVFDLRCVQRFSRAHVWKPGSSSVSKEVALQAIAEQFKAKQCNVCVSEAKGMCGSMVLNTTAVILPDFTNPDNKTVVIEMHDSIEKIKPEAMCTRLHTRAEIGELKQLILNEFGWRGVTICKNGRVVDCNSPIDSLESDGIVRLQAFKSIKKEVNLIFQPNPNVSYSYTMDVDVASTVASMKESYLKEFANDMLVRNMTEEQVMHLFCHDMPLDDQTCVGVLLKGGKERTLQMHIASRDAICITLHYREERGRAKVQRYQQLSVKPNCSTSDLRSEAAKYLKADPKSVKLTVENKRVEEDEDLLNSGIIRKGAIISAGTKKRKALQIRYPETNEEICVKLYMLEAVLVLKQEIARQLDVDEFHISLWCKNMEMKDNELLLNYPVKNNMELTVSIHQNRISLWVKILFRQTMVKLVVDDYTVTTVADILQYCASTYKYNRRFSRAIFQQRCLNPNSRLVEEDLQQESMIFVCFFDEPDRHLGELVRIFEVRTDGHTNPKLASVCRGYLFYAPDGLCLPQTGDENDTSANASVPSEVHADLEIRRRVSQQKVDRLHQHKYVEIRECGNGSVSRDKTLNKAKYLRRAKRILKRRHDDKEQTRKKLLFMNNDQYDGSVANPETGGKCTTKKEETPKHSEAIVGNKEGECAKDSSCPEETTANVNAEHELTDTPTKNTGYKQKEEKDGTRESQVISHTFNNLNSMTTAHKAGMFKKNLSESSAYYTTDVNDSSSSHDQLTDSKTRPVFQNQTRSHVHNYVTGMANGDFSQPAQIVPVSSLAASAEQVSATSESNPVSSCMPLSSQGRISVCERVLRQGGYKTV